MNLGVEKEKHMNSGVEKKKMRTWVQKRRNLNLDVEI